MKRYLFWLWIVGSFVVLLQLNRRLSDQLREAQDLANVTALESAEYRAAAYALAGERDALAEQLAKCKAGK